MKAGQTLVATEPASDDHAIAESARRFWPARAARARSRRGSRRAACKPQPRGKPSGRPFHGAFHRCRARRPGFTHPIIYGGVDTKSYIVEVVGCGVAFLDYDNDGWLDLFVLSGTRLDGAPPGTTNRLYKNNRDGTFTDVTGEGRTDARSAGRRRSPSATTTTTASTTSSSPATARTCCITTTATARSPT